MHADSESLKVYFDFNNQCIINNLNEIKKKFNFYNPEVNNMFKQIYQYLEQNKILFDKQNNEFNNINHITKILEKDNYEFVKNNIKLENEIKKIQYDIRSLQDEIKKVKYDNRIISNNYLTNKCIQALVDVITFDNLEKNDKLSLQFKEKLSILRKERNNICHYIKNEDIYDIKKKKIITTINKFKYINDNIKNKINNLLNMSKNKCIFEILINYYNRISLNNLTVRLEEQQFINDWWN
jgi:hypothetical protein